MQALKLDEFVDPETGEILEPDRQIVVEDLPKLARQLRAIERRGEAILTFRDEEVDRIRSLCDAKLTKLEESHTRLLAMAKALMREAGEERLDYPGLGVLRFGQTRESVNDEGYQSAPTDDKDILERQHPGLFNAKVTIRPDKKAIMAYLKDGKRIAGFSINQKYETFIFKAEK